MAASLRVSMITASALSLLSVEALSTWPLDGRIPAERAWTYRPTGEVEPS